MMFSKLSIFVVATFVAFAIAAGPLPQTGQTGPDSKPNDASKTDNEEFCPFLSAVSRISLFYTAPS